MDNEISKAIKRKTDAQMRMNATDITPVVNEGVGNTTIINDPSKYIIPMVAGQNVTIGTSGSNKVINALMNILAGDNITVTEPDENGAVTISASLQGKAVDLSNLVDGTVLSYDQLNDKFILSEMAGGGAELTQATETTLGGIKAKAKTVESAEVAIDPVTGKLYAPAAGEAQNGLPAGGVSGQVLSKVDGVDFNSQWADAPAGLPAGGLSGQVLAKVDEAYGNAQWIDPPSGASGMTSSRIGILLPSEIGTALTAQPAFWARVFCLGNCIINKVTFRANLLTVPIKLKIAEVSSLAGNATVLNWVYVGEYQAGGQINVFEGMTAILEYEKVYAFIFQAESGTFTTYNFDATRLGQGSLLQSPNPFGGNIAKDGTALTQYSGSTIGAIIEYEQV